MTTQLLISDIAADYIAYLDAYVCVNGWIKTLRTQKAMIFIQLNDGSCQNSLQVICKPELPNFDIIKSLTTGSSISVSGYIVKSPADGQLYEFDAQHITVYQKCDNEFPLQKVGLPIDFIRGLPHLRQRVNLMRAVFAIKSVVMESIHNYFTQKKFMHVDLPVLTTNACEGGCQPLQATSLLNNCGDIISNLPVKHTDDAYTIPSSKIDYSKDFFDRAVYLTVSNQLHLEAMAHGLGRVYTITAATRGEPAQTTRHLAHFNMLEYELCFSNIDDNIATSENCIKFCANQVLSKCANELELLTKNSDSLKTKLQTIANTPFTRITHRDAVHLLKSNKFTIEYNEDLSNEHEKWLVDHFSSPVIVMRYPKLVKAFYMPVCDAVSESDGSLTEYVDCFDLLMYTGEVVGGSQRIWDETELLLRMNELNIDVKQLDWYISLRKFGSVPHGGAGIGIERLVAAFTGMLNVKDCIAFPLTIHHCAY